MNFAIIGGNTRWSKILIKNFQKLNYKLIFTSSNFLEKKNNFKDFKKIPLKKIDFIVIASNTSKNFKAFKYFVNHKKPLFMEKPITKNYDSYLELKKLDKLKLVFVHYQHVYSEPITFLKKKLKKEKLISLEIDFGKNGPSKKDVNSSYEWLPHPMSIFYHLIDSNVKLSTKYSNYINKKKTNFRIYGKINDKILLNIHSGNNFKKKKYYIKVITNKMIYSYNASNPNVMTIRQLNRIKKKIQNFKNFPVISSIKSFSKILNNDSKKKLIVRQNRELTDKIMKFLRTNNL